MWPCRWLRSMRMWNFDVAYLGTRAEAEALTPLLTPRHWRLLYLYCYSFGSVVAKNICDFDDNGIAPRLIVFVEGSQEHFWLLLGAIGLPLVVEGILAIVPVNGPVIDPLAPMRNGTAYLIRDIIRWHKEIL